MRKILSLLTKLVLLALALFYSLTILLETPTPLCLVRGDSMLPNLRPGDLLLVSNRSGAEIAAGDVIVFKVSERDFIIFSNHNTSF